MYGSIGEESDDDAAPSSAATGTGGITAKDPLLPQREPSTAESRMLRKRKSNASNRRLKNTLLLREEEAGMQHAPVMKTLFHQKGSHAQKKKQQQQQQERRRSSLFQKQQQQQQKISNSSNPTPTTAVQGANPPSSGGSPRLGTGAQSNNKSKRKPHHHSWLYMLLHPRSTHQHSIWYKSFISSTILIDLAFFVASTEEVWRKNAHHLFYYEEGLVSSIFLLDYFCRLYVAPESHKYQHYQSTLKARWDYMWTIPAIIDAVSALPFFLEIPTGYALPNLTWLRFFRLIRILKAKSYMRSMETVWRVVYYNREILYVAFNMCFLLVLITAVLMYYLRPQDPEDAEDFSSLMATMYLSAMMLTGQGQPEGELPWYTKSVVLLTGVFSVAMFAIPASMLTWGFEAEAERCARKARQKYVASLQQEDEDNDDENDNFDDFSYANYISSSSSSEGDTTDEEYLDIIAGGEGDGEPGDSENGKNEVSPQDEVVKQLIRTFQTSDVDASGSLSMDEFIELMTDPSVVSQQLTMVGMATSLGIMSQRVQHLEGELRKSHRKLDQILKAVGDKGS